MPKDKRVKGCPNPNCPKAEGKTKYKSDDRYCVSCGNELVFVCAKCHGPLDDEGPKHRICAGCEAAAEDRKANGASMAKKASGFLAGVMLIGIGFIGKKRV